MPPPERVATFLREHANDPEPWELTLYDVVNDDDDKRGDPRLGRFLGRSALQRRRGDARVVSELAARLGRDSSYVDGDSGCITSEALGVRLVRGSASLDFIYNCGHVYLTPEGHTGTYALFSDEMVSFVVEQLGAVR